MRSAAATRDVVGAAAPVEPEWAWSVDVAGYDRRPGLQPVELVTLAALVDELDRRLPWPSRVPAVLDRLVRPVEDALARAGGVGRLRTGVLRVMAREIQCRRRVFWGWTHQEWVETLGATERDCLRRHRGMPEKRQHLIAVAYLLGDFTDWSAIGNINKLALARKIFGPERVDARVGRVLEAARGLGYGSMVDDRLQVALCEALLGNHSPRLQDLSPERFEALRRGRSPAQLRGWFVLGQALFGLGLWRRAPRPALRAPEGLRADESEGVASEWSTWCARWRSTSTLPPTSRVRYHRLLVLTGRCSAHTHPEVRGPEQWTRELAAAYVAALARDSVGQWGQTNNLDPALLGKPLAARTKGGYLGAVRVFFRDLQEWGWIPRLFNPRRDLATPRAVRALIGPDPRVIADSMWAELLWAGLNLTSDDLRVPHSGVRGAYPMSMIRALALVWLFAGLRRNEIRGGSRQPKRSTAAIPTRRRTPDLYSRV